MKVKRKIECPKCKSFEFNYVELEDGQKCIRSPCGWVLVDLTDAYTDDDFSEEDLE
jgi:hypothetical protein